MTNKTLEQLENDFWSSIPANSTGLVEEVFFLRKKKISELDSSDIRMLIIQEMGLVFLIPLALEILQIDALEDTLYYPGDLLMAILGVKKEYWKTNSVEKKILCDILTEVNSRIETTTAINEEIKKDLLKNIELFRKG